MIDLTPSHTRRKVLEVCKSSGIQKGKIKHLTPKIYLSHWFDGSGWSLMRLDSTNNGSRIAEITEESHDSFIQIAYLIFKGLEMI